MFMNLYTTTVSLLFIIVSMVTRVEGHPPVVHNNSVQDDMNTDEMQVSFVHGSNRLQRATGQDELTDIGVGWDENASADPWKLVSDRLLFFIY